MTSDERKAKWKPRRKGASKPSCCTLPLRPPVGHPAGVFHPGEHLCSMGYKRWLETAFDSTRISYVRDSADPLTVCVE